MNIMGTLLNKLCYTKITLTSVKLIISKNAFCVKRNAYKLGYKIFVKNSLFNDLKTNAHLSYSVNILDIYQQNVYLLGFVFI